MSLLVVGPVGLDEMTWPWGTRENLLGGAVPAFALAASHFETVRIVSVVGDDFPATHRAALARDGIDLSGLRTVPGETFRWGARYEEDLNVRETLYTRLGVYAEHVPEVPITFVSNDVVFTSATHPAQQEHTLAQVRPTSRVCALDTQDPWIEEARADLFRALRLADIALIADDEALRLTRTHTPRAAARALAEREVHFLTMKLGSHGALLFGPEDRIFAAPAWPVEHVVDPTGAGDAFAGGFLGYLASQLRGGGEFTWQALCEATVWGAVLGSFSCEGPGVERLLSVTRAELDARRAKLLSLTRPDIETILLPEYS